MTNAEKAFVKLSMSIDISYYIGKKDAEAIKEACCPKPKKEEKPAPKPKAKPKAKSSVEGE